MTDDRTPRKIACEMQPFVRSMVNASAAMHAARFDTATVLYILATIEKDAAQLKVLWRELYDLTHKGYKVPLKAVAE